MSEYQEHPASSLFPMMDEAGLRELAADIRENGLLEPIILYDNMILDGRNRLAACKRVAVDPAFVTLSEIPSPVLYVLSHNLHRRHLTPSQRGAIAVDAEPLLQEEAKHRMLAGKKVEPDTLRPIGHRGDIERKGSVRELAAEMLQVGEGTVQRAHEVKQRDPELFEKIKRGEVTAHAARDRVGGRTPKKPSASPYNPDTKRKRELAKSQRQKMVKGLSLISGACHGLESLDVSMVIAACDAEELGTWATKAETHARELRRFAAKLRGASGNGEPSQGTHDQDAR